MDTNISMSVNNPITNTEGAITSSLTPISGSNTVNALYKGRRGGRLNPPWPKGVSGNASGKKGPHVKAALLRKTSKRAVANELADKIIANTKSIVIPESTRAIEVILKAEGGAYDKNDTPLVAVQNNNTIIDAATIEAAIEFLKSKKI